MKPNLFVIGAAKSGTTSLHQALADHRDILTSEPKEPAFFVPEVGYYPADVDWYMSLFEAAGEARYRGESSTHYSKLPLFPDVPRRIAEFVDEPPRFIYLMRDPLDRLISHYWHNVRKLSEHWQIGPAIRDSDEYLALSHYRMQLEPYFARFGRESVSCITFEAMRDHPDDVLGQVFQWLGVDPRHRSGVDRANARPPVIRGVQGRGRLDRLARTAVWGRLSPFVPGRLKNAAKSLAYQTVHPDAGKVERLIEELRPDMRTQVRELEGYLGRTFPEWTLTMGDNAGGERP